MIAWPSSPLTSSTTRVATSSGTWPISRAVLGGRLHFAVEGMGARVAAIELAPPPPMFLLADHVKGDTPILVYRVANLRKALTDLKKGGWSEESTFEIPHGPICSFHAPGGQRIAVYQLTRPGAAASFEGRRDF